MLKQDILDDLEYNEIIYEIKEVKDDIKFNANLKFNVMTLSVNSCLNVGNIIRTSNLTGVDKFFVFGKRRYDKKSSVKAYKYANVIRVNEDFPLGIDEKNNKDLVDKMTKTKLDTPDYIFNTDVFIGVMKKYNMIPIFVEQSSKSVKLSNVNWNQLNNQIKPEQTFCFVFGNEHYGIPQNILQCVNLFEKSFILELEQSGYINSFNVSNTASIVLNSYYLNEMKNVKNRYFL